MQSNLYNTTQASAVQCSVVDVHVVVQNSAFNYILIAVTIVDYYIIQFTVFSIHTRNLTM